MPLLHRAIITTCVAAVLGLMVVALLRSHIVDTERMSALLGAQPQIPVLPPDPPVDDNFPLAASATSPNDLPLVPSWNRPNSRYTNERTPLLIGFTRNWRILQQTVVGYITAGWPPEDIYVIENTGTFESNRQKRLTLQNQFYMDHARLTDIFGVNVVSTPTLLSFAQLQNFYLHLALEKSWKHYFWSHMDVLVLPNEEIEPYVSLYGRAVEEMRKANTSGEKWAILFFAYDRLALVNTEAFVDVGGWDTFIPYYGTDCDMHERLMMKDYVLRDAHAGLIYDIASSVPDLRVFYREDDEKALADCPADAPPDKRQHGRANCVYHQLTRKADGMQAEKNNNKGGRNYWQGRQHGGNGEPYYKDAIGFDKAVDMTAEFGKELMAKKWDQPGCNLRGTGHSLSDEWRKVREERAKELAKELAKGG